MVYIKKSEYIFTKIHRREQHLICKDFTESLYPVQTGISPNMAIISKKQAEINSIASKLRRFPPLSGLCMLVHN